MSHFFLSIKNTISIHKCFHKHPETHTFSSVHPWRGEVEKSYLISALHLLTCSSISICTGCPDVCHFHADPDSGDITEDKLSDLIELPLEPQKCLIQLFHMRRTKTCKQSVMCKISGSPLIRYHTMQHLRLRGK